MSSPYKKLKVANKEWIGFTNISKLEPNKAYRIRYIRETNHPEYGPGQQATILAHDGRKWRTQLPGKYLSQLSKEDIEIMKKDMMQKKNIFLIFREKMIDNSYRIDITENDLCVENFHGNVDVPVLQTSIKKDDNVESPDDDKPGKDDIPLEGNKNAGKDANPPKKKVNHQKLSLKASVFKQGKCS